MWMPRMSESKCTFAGTGFVQRCNGIQGCACCVPLHNEAGNSDMWARSGKSGRVDPADGSSQITAGKRWPASMSYGVKRLPVHELAACVCVNAGAPRFGALGLPFKCSLSLCSKAKLLVFLPPS